MEGTLPTAIYAELLRDADDALVKRLMLDDDYVWQEKFDGCIEYHSRIEMADGSNKYIPEIKVGDWVLGVDKDGIVVPAEVTTVFRKGKTDAWTKVRCTR